MRFFALYRERAGLRELPVELPVGSTVSRMVAEVRRLFPDLAPPTVDIVVSVNAEYAGPDTQLSESDDVALIPPVSGGQDMIEITTTSIDPEKVTAKVRGDSNGAVVTFLGTTRLFAEGKRVLYLEYEAYTEMALSEMGKIRHDIQAEYSLQDIGVTHRIGRVDIGEISLVVAVASPHRRGSFPGLPRDGGPAQAKGAHLEERVLRRRISLGRLRGPRACPSPESPLASDGDQAQPETPAHSSPSALSVRLKT